MQGFEIIYFSATQPSTAAENTNLRGSNTVRLISCLTGLDLTKQVKM